MTSAQHRYFDAHNHLHDERFAGRQNELLAAAKEAGVVNMVVNGSCEDDWNEVTQLAAHDKTVIPSLGLHPWYHHERTSHWLDKLTGFLQRQPSAIGEIGLDRWKKDLSYHDQEEVFLAQWNLARELNRPASIHCLKAWGRLLELLQQNPGPSRGFLLHSYGGPAEMVPALAKLGAYFSFPGYYMHERKEKQRQTFKQIPMDRLLIETDAPDQLMPEALNRHPISDAAGHALNHPANLPVIYDFMAQLRGVAGAALERQVEENFIRLFG